jgi:hypothetical protein
MANNFDLVPVDYDPFTVGAADVPSSAGRQRYDPSSDDELNVRSEGSCRDCLHCCRLGPRSDRAETPYGDRGEAFRVLCHAARPISTRR